MFDVPSPIDAVIAWVDGSDPVHIRKRIEFTKNQGDDGHDEVATGRDSTRFRDNGEVEYCIRSIRAFAPWVRTIWLVTDEQVPEFMTPGFQELYGVTVVDHRDIFAGYEWALPTFNTRTIESALWRIPGLAERFIYFNDDFILTGDVAPGDFFTENSVVLRGGWESILNYGPVLLKLNRIYSLLIKKLFGITRSMHLLLQMNSARLAGFSRNYFRMPHVPHPVVKSTLDDYFRLHPEHFEENIRHRFRSTSQFSAIFLAHHLELARSAAEQRSARGHVMINGETDTARQLRRKCKAIETGKARFICLQGLEYFEPDQREKVINAINNAITAREMQRLEEYSMLQPQPETPLTSA